MLSKSIRVSSVLKRFTYLPKDTNVTNELPLRRDTTRNMILSSKNKMRSTWKIINPERGKSKPSTDIHSLMTDNNVITNQSIIPKNFNNYFLSFADSINSNTNKHVNIANPINYLSDKFTKSFTKINWHYATANEIRRVSRK